MNEKLNSIFASGASATGGATQKKAVRKESESQSKK